LDEEFRRSIVGKYCLSALKGETMAGEKGHNVPLPRLEALGGAYGVFSNKTTRALSRGWSLVVNKKWICGERSDD